jgi:hypothetical protein
MIKYLKHSEIDKAKWDACITNSSNKNIYANSWYLDVVCPTWEALIDGDYQALMPLTCNKKYGINYLYQPYFTQQLGIFGRDKLSNEKMNEFLNAIPSYYRFIEINLNINNSIQNKDFEINNLPTHLLDLNQSYKVIYANYSDNLKRNLSKANKANLTLVKDVNIDDLIHLFRFNKGKDVSNLKNKDYATFKRLTKAIQDNATLNNWGVQNEKGELIASAIFPKFNHQAVFLFSGLNEEGKQVGAMPLLINSFIKEHAGQNLVLDFEGSKDTNLARFYKSFGSIEYLYPQIRKNTLPSPIKWIKS